MTQTTEPQLATVQFDARFPNTNQTKNCWQNYVDFHKCVKAKGEDYPVCQYFRKAYKSLCPSIWTNRWDEEVAEGRFPADI
mmetsp:Transcript_26598/g.26478  ORF Transcript_26598/g.26478 Transcript_26598/m.26478 type:complete len:81 (+) Transcript_26598:42-284(+)|eukprot:CAMPEP_0197013172 /NCGR_PEP_ID=MMETSP1380-20130617/65358_1 /TAXON_ID=5936 /ORGANISM="Euplotes crassus, Strain CT5" /LENGTH=80 /DNA_ID=CAMNT_0042437231 /DNA_START=42 /DNA_END=284 /DNA_ORIENTATION=+